GPSAVLRMRNHTAGPASVSTSTYSLLSSAVTLSEGTSKMVCTSPDWRAEMRALASVSGRNTRVSLATSPSQYSSFASRTTFWFASHSANLNAPVPTGFWPKESLSSDDGGTMRPVGYARFDRNGANTSFNSK